MNKVGNPEMKEGQEGANAELEAVDTRVVAIDDPQWRELAGEKLEQYRRRLYRYRSKPENVAKAPELFAHTSTSYMLRLMEQLVKSGSFSRKEMAETFLAGDVLFHEINFHKAVGVMICYTDEEKGLAFLEQRVAETAAWEASLEQND